VRSHLVCLRVLQILPRLSSRYHSSYTVPHFRFYLSTSTRSSQCPSSYQEVVP
jgi:hypothetical protein